MRTRPQTTEEWLRRVWADRLFRPEGLRTDDGRPVDVIFPGTLNPDGGPDFRDAVVRIGGTVFAGDVEVHPGAGAWSTHGHDRDPHYNGVVLHVVLRGGRRPARTLSRRVVPTLPLEGRVPAAESGSTAGSLPPPGIPPCLAGRRRIGEDSVRRLLGRLAYRRIASKVAHLRARLADVQVEESLLQGRRRSLHSRAVWEQLLYEGVMEALGYAKNREPFRALARSLRLTDLRRHDLARPHTMMALLFGTAGLLPSTRRIPEPESRRYVLALRRRWRELQPTLRRPLLHEADWTFFRLRPANFPTARLAVLSHLLPRLFGEGSLRNVLALLAGGGLPGRQLWPATRALLSAPTDGYWARHVQFRGRAARSGARLGTSRSIDIVVNVLVPFLLLYAGTFRRPDLRRSALALLRALPTGSPGARVRQAARALGPSSHPPSAFLQQGLLALLQGGCPVCRRGRCGAGG